jgi:uncharacterized membrane protein YgcG
MSRHAHRFPASIGAALALSAWAALGLGSCKAREGDRCICADDCREGLVCLAAGRVLGEGDCSPAVGDDAQPGECLDPDAAGLGDDGFEDPPLYMDLGSKRDFDPQPPPEPTSTSTGTGTGTGTAGTTTDTTDSASSSSGSSGSGGSSGSSGDSGSSGSGSSSGSSSSTSGG